jgi:FlaG/FlaF family flagellin (archaellin)
MQNKHGQEIEKMSINGIPIQLKEAEVKVEVEDVVLQSEEEIGMTDEEIEAFDNALLGGMTYTEVEQ